jgi:hypothetical protein
LAIGAGNSLANDAEGQSVSVSSQFGCLTVDIAELVEGRTIGPDVALDLTVTATMTGAGFVQFGPADVTLTPDPG